MVAQFSAQAFILFMSQVEQWWHTLCVLQTRLLQALVLHALRDNTVVRALARGALRPMNLELELVGGSARGVAGVHLVNTLFRGGDGETVINRKFN